MTFAFFSSFVSHWVGSTSRTEYFTPPNASSNFLPVGRRYVRGGNKISASPGNAERYERSAPRLMNELVRSLSRSEEDEIEGQEGSKNDP